MSSFLSFSPLIAFDFRRKNCYTTPMKIIFTCQEQGFLTARRELEAAFPGARTAFLGPGAGLLDAQAGFENISEVCLRRPVLFTRHIFPVHVELPPEADPLDALDDISSRLDLGRSFSVQARAENGNAAPRALSEALQARGFSLDIRSPAQAVSIYRAARAMYIGVSDTSLNLSNWNGGMMHFSSEGLISRAECKLLESLSVFHIPAGASQTALDLGAAPGGWSNALAAKGVKVTAVDPAALDDRVSSLPLVAHAAITAQEFLQGDHNVYDLILNDMKMDARDALRLLLPCKERLKPGGVILTTLKLPKERTAATAGACVAMIREKATLLGARQLFHNRSEITAAFR